MRSDLLKKALVGRRGKNFNYDEFIKEDEQEDASKPSSDGLAPKPLATTPKDQVPQDQVVPSDAESVLGRKPFDKKSQPWAEDPSSLGQSGEVRPDDDGVDREIGKGLLDEKLANQLENGRKPKSLHERAQMHISKLIKK